MSPGGVRRADAIAAATWLAAQPFTPPGGVVVMGWSNGGSTVLATARAGRSGLPPGLIRGYVAFYPGCNFYANEGTWQPAGPMLVLMGAADDWTPAEPCRRLFAGKSAITYVEYPGAYHDFDAPGLPLRTRRGLQAGSVGTVHVGTDPAARADALARVPAYLAALPPMR